MLFIDDLNEVSAEVIGLDDHFIVRISNNPNDETYAILHYHNEDEAIKKAKEFCDINEFQPS